jgi:hypothetical protein
LQKFLQNALFGNVNLDLRLLQQDKSIRENTLLTTLSHVLPLINNNSINFNSIQVGSIAQLANFQSANNDLAMRMLERARILAIL